MSSAPKLDDRDRPHFNSEPPAATGVLRIARSLNNEASLPVEKSDAAALERSDPPTALRDATHDVPANDLADIAPHAPEAESQVSSTDLGAQTYREARKEAIAHFERVYVEALLDRCGGNVSQGARIAGVDRVYLHRLLRKHALRSSKSHPHARESVRPQANLAEKEELATDGDDA